MAPLPSTTITKPESRLDQNNQNHADVEDLYRRHRSNGIRFARRRGADDPESLFNHVFVDVMAKASSIDDPSDDAIAAYLYRSINNRVIAEHRRRREPLVTYDERIHGTYDPGEMFEEDVVRTEWVQELLEHLTESERAVIINRYFGENNSVETAMLLDKSPEAVRQLHRSAMIRLRFVLTVAAVVVIGALAFAALRAVLSEPVSTAPADADDTSLELFDLGETEVPGESETTLEETADVPGNQQSDNEGSPNTTNIDTESAAATITSEIETANSNGLVEAGADLPVGGQLITDQAAETADGTGDESTPAIEGNANATNPDDLDRVLKDEDAPGR